MAEIVKREELSDGGWLEYWDNGRICAKNLEGMFISHPANYTPPDVARDTKLGRSKRRSGVTIEEVDNLLAVLPSELLQDERREWIIRHLAASLVVGGAGTASVARELLAQIQLPQARQMMYDKPGLDEVCPLCGRSPINTILQNDAVQFAIVQLAARLEAQESESARENTGKPC